MVAANLPADAVAKQMAGSVCGIYMGWAGLASRGVFKMVMSVGWNPYFDNKVKSVVSESVIAAAVSLYRSFFIVLRLLYMDDRSLGFCTILMKTFMVKSCGLLLLDIYDQR